MGSIDAKSFVFASGWTFRADLRDDAGLVLNKVRHADNSFATDMRIVRIYVFPGGPDKFGVYQKRGYVLGRSDCPAIGGQMTLEAPSTKILIGPYSPAQQLSAEFDAEPAAKGSQKIRFKQTYVFTDYNKSPSHEPGGFVQAARLYPLLRFSYVGLDGERNPPERIRVDYRFDVSLDGATFNANGSSPNLVGVFADDDGVSLDITNIFRQAYKPLPLEMVGTGLIDGKSSSTYWDNIHHWAQRADLPPTPGAANAAHSHWRWGKPATLPPNTDHYKGLGGAGGPLLDPTIPNQNLSFAITGRAPQPAVASWDPATAIPSSETFSDLFTNGRPQPADIKNGSTLTQWWSIEATRSPEEARRNPDWHGTFFVHGFFFAHGPELEATSLKIASALGRFTQPLEKPPLSRAGRQSWFKP